MSCTIAFVCASRDAAAPDACTLLRDVVPVIASHDVTVVSCLPLTVSDGGAGVAGVLREAAAAATGGAAYGCRLSAVMKSRGGAHDGATQRAVYGVFYRLSAVARAGRGAFVSAPSSLDDGDAVAAAAAAAGLMRRPPFVLALVMHDGTSVTLVALRPARGATRLAELAADAVSARGGNVRARWASLSVGLCLYLCGTMECVCVCVCVHVHVHVHVHCTCVAFTCLRMRMRARTPAAVLNGLAGAVRRGLPSSSSSFFFSLSLKFASLLP